MYNYRPLKLSSFLSFWNELYLYFVIIGVGSTMSKKLAKLGVVSIEQLQEVPVSQLVPEIGEIQALTIKRLSYGVDDSPVVPYGRPQVNNTG